MLISRNVEIVTATAGVAYPVQLPMMSTPYGRGRVVPAVIGTVAASRRNRLHRNTSRCRQRRNVIVITTADSPATVTAQPEPTAEIPWAASVSHGVRTRAKSLSTAELTWLSSRSDGARTEITIPPASTTTARTSQALVVAETGCGSGGGAPVGRRRCGVVITSVFSLIATCLPLGSAGRRVPAAAGSFS